MLRIDRTATRSTAMTPARCLEVIAAVAAYPAWSSLITTAQVIEAKRPPTVQLHARVLGLPIEMICTLAVTAGGAELVRLPESEDDDETFTATWTVRPADAGAEVGLTVVAALDAPGPARVLQDRVARRLVDDLLADFAAVA